MRSAISTPFNRFGLSKLARAVRGSIFRHLPILAYHRVLDVTEPFIGDRALVSTSTSRFEQQMQYLARNYQALSIDDVVQCLLNDRPLPRNAVLVTFDDGYRDNYLNAFPILNKYGIKATFFVSSDLVDTENRHWFDDIHAKVLTASAVSFESTVLGTNFQLPEDMHGRTHLANNLVALAKCLDNFQLDELLHEVTEQLNGSQASSEHACLTSKMMQQMSAAGMDFGSHSASHAVLSRITDDKLLESELSRSKEAIEAIIQKEVTSISYPVGGRQSFDARVIVKARQSGYLLGFSYISGTNKLPISTAEQLMMRRIHVEEDTSLHQFCASLALPEFFCYPTRSESN